MTDPIDVRIGRRAAMQQNIVTREQLLFLGLGAKAITYRAKVGRLHREFPGVYSIGRAAVTVYEHSSAAVLACGPGAKLAGESAMCIWGFWTRWPKQPEVVVPGDRRPKGITVHRCTTLTRGDVARHHGIPVTNPAHTILVVAPRLTEDGLWRTIDDALHTPYLHRTSLIEQIIRHHLYPGASLIREYLLTATARPARTGSARSRPSACSGAYRSRSSVWSSPVARPTRTGQGRASFWSSTAGSSTRAGARSSETETAMSTCSLRIGSPSG